MSSARLVARWKTRDNVRWLSVAHAAKQLDLTPLALRRRLERRAKRNDDGSVEARFDGIRAHKIGRAWRVSLGKRWCLDDAS